VVQFEAINNASSVRKAMMLSLGQKLGLSLAHMHASPELHMISVVGLSSAGKPVQAAGNQGLEDARRQLPA